MESQFGSRGVETICGIKHLAFGFAHLVPRRSNRSWPTPDWPHHVYAKVGNGNVSHNTTGIPNPSSSPPMVGIVHICSLNRFFQESMVPRYWWSFSVPWECVTGCGERGSADTGAGEPFRAKMTMAHAACHAHPRPRSSLARTCSDALDRDGYMRGRATGILPVQEIMAESAIGGEVRGASCQLLSSKGASRRPWPGMARMAMAQAGQAVPPHNLPVNWTKSRLPSGRKLTLTRFES